MRTGKHPRLLRADPHVSGSYGDDGVHVDCAPSNLIRRIPFSCTCGFLNLIQNLFGVYYYFRNYRDIYLSKLKY